MILKYNSLEKDMCKRMFAGKNKNSTDSNNNDTVALDAKVLNDETKTYITEKLE